MQKYDILLFDADNTLLDFTTAEYNAFRLTAESCGLTYSDELYRTYSAINDGLWKRLERQKVTLDQLKTERFRLLLLETGLPASDDVSRRMSETYMSSLGTQSCLIDGAEEICRRLSRVYTMCLVTNGIASIQRSRIDGSLLKPYFPHVFISEEIGAAKPKPEFFDHVMEKLGYPPKERVLVIGDSLTSDCDGAIAYGLDVCRYNPDGLSDNGRPITYTVKKLAELAELLLVED